MSCNHRDENNVMTLESAVVTDKAILGSSTTHFVIACWCTQCNAQWTCTDYNPVLTQEGDKQ